MRAIGEPLGALGPMGNEGHLVKAARLGAQVEQELERIRLLLQNMGQS